MQRSVLLASGVLAALAALAVAHPMHRCPPPLGKWPFDAQKFAGEWYVVAHTPWRKQPEPETVCHKLDYSMEPQGNETRVAIQITVKTAEKTLEPQVKGRFGSRPTSGSVVQGVWRPSSEEKWKDDVFTMSVLMTDYETYAVVASCSEKYLEKTDSFHRFLLAHVWSRTPQLDATTLGVCKNLLTGLGVDETSITDQDNSGC